MFPKTLLAMVAFATVTLGFSTGQGVATAAPVAISAQLGLAARGASPRLTKLVAEALHQTTLRISYSYGGGHGSRPAPLNSHVDCSGFVREMYGYAFGVDIGGGSGDSMVRTSGKFTKTYHPVPGDVALFGNSGRPPAYHSGIYIGNVNGHPAVAASPSTGSDIKIQQWYNRYWSGDLMGYWHFTGATAADSSPAVRPKMNGHFDAASGIRGGLSIIGWALDPARRTSTTIVRVFVDNRLVGSIATGTYRADVNKARAATGNHGFRAAVPAGPGRHRVCLTAQPLGTTTAPSSLGCRALITPGRTTGLLEKVTAGPRNFVVRGWAFDPHSSAAADLVRLTVDGHPVINVHASFARPDVDRVFGITGRHGFAGRLAASPGRHTVCAIALPVSGHSFQSAIGCKVVTVTK